MDENLADVIERDHTGAAIEPRWLRLLDHAVKLTLTPSACSRADVDALRAAGLTDEQIVDGVQVAAFFNYINRVADALGVDPERL